MASHQQTIDNEAAMGVEDIGELAYFIARGGKLPPSDTANVSNMEMLLFKLVGICEQIKQGKRGWLNAYKDTLYGYEVYYKGNREAGKGERILEIKTPRSSFRNFVIVANYYKIRAGDNKSKHIVMIKVNEVAKLILPPHWGAKG